MSLHTSIKVRWSELDPYHHVNHAVYLTYLESARIEALDEIGFGMDNLREEACQIVVTEMSIRFHRSAMAGDLLDIETEMLEVRRASTRWRQTIRRARRGLRDRRVGWGHHRSVGTAPPLARRVCRSAGDDPGARSNNVTISGRVVSLLRA